MAKFIFIFMASAFLLSCAKNSDNNQEQISLQSPDGTIKLGNSIKEAVLSIKVSTGIKDPLEISKIEYPVCSRGSYAIITYTTKSGKENNIIYSTFPLSTSSSSTIIHSSDSKTSGELLTVPACYEYWCTTAGSCTSCGVRISDPFGSPTLSCSCNECHLHQKKYDCPQ